MSKVSSLKSALFIVPALATLFISLASVPAPKAAAANYCVNNVYSVGSQGTCVKYLQILLNNAAFSSLNADGIYGNLTRSAVVKLQRTDGPRIRASVDGIAGRQTWYLACNPQHGPDSTTVATAKSAAGCSTTRYWY